MNVIDNQRARILDEIIAATEPPRRKKYQFSRLEYQDRKHVTLSKARHALDKMVNNGLLKKELVLLDEKWTNVFWRPEDEAQASRD